MEEILKQIMVDQAELAIEVYKNQLETKNFEKVLGQLASSQNSRQ